MNDLFSLAGKNILITGSAQGIGSVSYTHLAFFSASPTVYMNDCTLTMVDLFGCVGAS